MADSPTPIPTATPTATQVIARARLGDPAAAAQLFNLMYAQLRAIAGELMSRRATAHTLQPTALVHEAFVRLVRTPSSGWTDRGHFLAVAAKTMRNLLIDHARRRRADKRGGRGDDAWARISLDGLVHDGRAPGLDLLAMDELLNDLAKLHQRQARVVELRFFAGLTIPQTARALGVSHTTVENDWSMARAWLITRLQDNASPAG